MTRRSITVSILWAAALALLLAIANGEQEVVSLQLWLAGFTTWLALVLFVRLLEALPLGDTRALSLFKLPSRSTTTVVDRRTRELRSASNLVARSLTNERVHNQQMQPRLAALAAHFLPVRHGIDPVKNPQGAANVLGDVAWLIDPAVAHRSPTVPELRSFFARIDGSDESQRKNEVS